MNRKNVLSVEDRISEGEFSKFASWISSIRLLWKPVKNANSRSPFQTYYI